MTSPLLLVNRFQGVLQKRLGLALGVWGEAGVGKSHRVQELLRTLPCQSLGVHATTPLTSLTQTLPKPKKLPLWAEHNLKRVAKQEAVERTSTLESLGTLFAGLAPFVLHLEDIHEADAERLEFIQALAKVVLRIKGVALVVTSRRAPPEPFTTIKLESLSQQDADRLLETELKNALPNEALKWIYDKAAGNPLYSLEYLRYLTRQGFLWNDGKHWHWRKPPNDAMPVTVEALIEQLLSQAKVEPLQRYVLETRAFLPLNASDELWQKVVRVNEQELQTAVAKLSQQGIFKEDDFAHPLFREMTLKTLSSERKISLARRTINVLQDSPEQAATFVAEARLESSRALELLKKAAEHVTERNEVEAATFLASAAMYAEGEEKTKLRLEAVTALQFHDIPKTVTLLEGLLSENPTHTEALYLATLFYGREAQGAKAEAMFARLPEHERMSQRGVETLLELYFLLDKYTDFLTLWEKNKALQNSLNPRLIGRAVYIAAGQLRTQEAIDLALRALERTDLSEKQRIALLNPLAIAYDNSNQHEKSEEIFNRLVATPPHLLPGKGLRIMLHNRALARKSLGRYLEAKKDALENYRLASEAGDSFSVGKALTQLGELAIELGNYEEAERYLSDSLPLVKQRNVTLFVVDAEIAMSLLYQAWVTAHSGILALKHARSGLEVAQSTEYTLSRLEALFCAACAETAYGSAAKALELAAELATLAKDHTAHAGLYYGAWAKAKALTALNRASEARLLFQQAYEVAKQIRHEVNQQKISLDLDRLGNDVEGARKRMEWFEERGLMNGVNIAKRHFPELAERRQPTKQVENQVRLEILGTLQVRGDKVSPIRGRKRQELLALLLEARISGRNEVSRLTLLDTLYPEEDELKASASLKSLVHSLRETLGENTITTTNNGYALGSCTSDAELFLQTGDTSLWRGLYLEDLESDDSTVRDSLYLALFEKVKTLLEIDPKEAARVGGILLEADPYNTDYLKTYLTALRLSNNHGKLTRHYREAKTRLLEVGETLPDTWQGFLS
jgi:DNA-binding SARP family transcriptional activator